MSSVSCSKHVPCRVPSPLSRVRMWSGSVPACGSQGQHPTRLGEAERPAQRPAETDAVLPVGEMHKKELTWFTV